MLVVVVSEQLVVVSWQQMLAGVDSGGGVTHVPAWATAGIPMATGVSGHAAPLAATSPRRNVPPADVLQT
jgi:hypothetical protein